MNSLGRLPSGNCQPPQPEPLYELPRLLSLDVETGALYWKVDRLSGKGRKVQAKAGARAGSVNGDGYRTVYIDRAGFKAHRIVFALANGRWPEGDLDHINGQRDDNRPANLREATGSQNNYNSKMRSDNKSGLRGVHEARPGRFVAQINIEGKRTHLGTFKTPEEASQAYLCIAIEQRGEFFREAS